MQGKVTVPVPMINKGGATWRAVSTWAEEALEDARNQLETPRSGERMTSVLRGRCAVLREILGLPEAIEMNEKIKHPTQTGYLDLPASVNF